MQEEKRTWEFDRMVNRRSTNDLKWRREGVQKYLNQNVREDMIPMWIADMDFGCMKEIVQAINMRAIQGVFGYCAPGPEFGNGIAFWEQTRFGWNISPEWITSLPSVVSGINIAIRGFSKEGEGVIIQTPVYDPFIEITKRTGRIPVFNQLKRNDGHYEMDYEGLEKLAKDKNNRILILCSPHNPVGRVWTEEELRKLAEICLENDVMIVTDEIHSDLVYKGHRHVPLLSLDKRYADSFIYLSAPGKTFNIPGLKVSFAIIPNEEKKKIFDGMQLSLSLDIRNTFGVECIKACYTKRGEEWLKDLLDYLSGNIEIVSQFLQKEMPFVRMEKPEGTFLCWLDFTDLGIEDEELFKRVNLDAGVICVPGTWFGPGGEHHLRLNIGCQRTMLQEALTRIKKALV